jgi:hypothetical protein
MLIHMSAIYEEVCFQSWNSKSYFLFFKHVLISLLANLEVKNKKNNSDSHFDQCLNIPWIC